MTMDASSDEVDYLTSHIISSKEPVTYHTLSRELKIHSDYAKRILYDFYKSNKDKLTASFIITGKDQLGKTLVKLSGNENLLANDMTVYSKINTIHVYCVLLKESPTTNFDISSLELKYTVDHSSIEEYVKTGLIKGPELVKANTLAPASRSKPAPVEVKSDSSRASTPSSSSKPAKTATLSSGYVSRKASNNSSPATATKSAHSSLLSHYVSRKAQAAEPKPPAKRTNTEATGYVYQSRKAQKKEPKERVVISNVDDDNEDNDAKNDKYAKPPSKFTTSELENLFLDDFSEDEEANDTVQDKPEDEPIIIANEPEKEEPQDILPAVVEEREKSPSVDITKSLSTKKATPEVESAKEVETEAPRETTVDEDGYITSYRAKKPETKPAPKTTPDRSRSSSNTPSSKKKSDNKSKKQTSLMNFFKAK